MAKRRSKRSSLTGIELAIVGVAIVIAIFGSRLGGQELARAAIIVLAVLLLIVLAIIFTIVLRQQRHSRRHLSALRTLTLTDIDNFSGTEFEDYVAEILKTQGYKVATTAVTGDFGVDLIARKGEVSYAVQLKRYGKPIGQPAIREAVAGKLHYGCTAAMVVTSNYITASGRKLAKSTDCALIDRSKLAEWVEEFGAHPHVI